METKIRVKETPTGWVYIPQRAGQSLANLYVYREDLGIVQKPEDRDGDVNAWRAFKGIGHGQTFLGHHRTREGAMEMVESACKSETDTPWAPTRP